MSEQTNQINGVDVEGLRRFRDQARQDLSCADRNPQLVATWVGADGSRVKLRDIELDVGVPGRMNPMQLLLASLAACDVDVIATHASLLGIELEKLSIEATGHFNVRSYLGIEGAPGSGYDQIAYTVRLRAPRATREQLSRLRAALERSSPVGDSLNRPVALRMSFEAET